MIRAAPDARDPLNPVLPCCSSFTRGVHSACWMPMPAEASRLRASCRSWGSSSPCRAENWASRSRARTSSSGSSENSHSESLMPSNAGSPSPAAEGRGHSQKTRLGTHGHKRRVTFPSPPAPPNGQRACARARVPQATRRTPPLLTLREAHLLAAPAERLLPDLLHVLKVLAVALLLLGLAAVPLGALGLGAAPGPRLRAPPFGIEHRPVVQVVEGWDRADQRLAVVLQVADKRVPLEVQAGEVGHPKRKGRRRGATGRQSRWPGWGLPAAAAAAGQSHGKRGRLGPGYARTLPRWAGLRTS